MLGDPDGSTEVGVPLAGDYVRADLGLEVVSPGPPGPAICTALPCMSMPVSASGAGTSAVRRGWHISGPEVGARSHTCLPAPSRVAQDSQIVTSTTWPPRLVLNRRPLVLNSCSMGVFSGSTSAIKVWSPAARAILAR